jgi:hypothetical protein
MKRLAWLTDLHLNFVMGDDHIATLAQDIRECARMPF